MVRRPSVANLRSLMQSVYNQINITFPEDFGDPEILRMGETYLAAFPAHVQMQVKVGGQPQYCRAIGQGNSPVEAMTRLFTEFANSENYEAIALRDRTSAMEEIFYAREYPYGTCAFSRLGSFPVLSSVPR